MFSSASHGNQSGGMLDGAVAAAEQSLCQLPSLRCFECELPMQLPSTAGDTHLSPPLLPRTALPDTVVPQAWADEWPP